VAAMRAFIPCVEEFREKSVADELERWRLAFSMTEGRAIAAIELMRPIPERFSKTGKKTTAPENETFADSVNTPDQDTTSVQESTSQTDQLDQIGGFFGASGSNEDSEPESEMETASEDSSPLDLAASLFGNAPASPAGPTKASDDEDSERLSQVDPSRLGSAAYWMTRWQQHDESLARPTWIRNCEPILRQIAEAGATQNGTVDGTADGSETERRWANAALATCGDVGRADAILQAAQQASDTDPRVDLVVDWLPAEARVKWVRDHLNDLTSEETDSSLAANWDAATLIESTEIANALDEFLGRSEDLSNELLVRLVHLLQRSLTGGLGDHHATLVDEDDLATDDSGLLAKRKVSGIHPHQAEVTQWLIDRYTSAKSRRHRAVLLAVLARVSRRHATAEALALVEQSAEDAILRRTAAALALGDLSSLSVDRAVVLLEHPNHEIVDAALLRLSCNNSFEGIQEENIGVPVVYRSAGLHPLQRTTQSLSEDTLNRLSKTENKTSAAIADTLLVSLGKEIPLDPLLDRLGGVERPLTLLAIALAKAKRTDDDAIEIYRRCAQVVQWQDEEAVRTALQPLRDDRVKKIIKTHLQEYDGMFSF
ncbi:hypothetical protein, partial [Stieleria sp.]|uniref:hypothetical protein n=1 Tax=Stieleria sp. TaxID=2795976 RepID=UPI003563A3EE